MKNSLSTLLNPIRSIPIVASIPSNVFNINRIVLGTHDGTFHCDEALALGLLLMLPQFQQDAGSPAIICRTRDPKELAVSLPLLVLDLSVIF